MTSCPRIGKLFGGCKFSPRYDRIAPTAEQLAALIYQLTIDIEGATSARYVADVCERCGATIERVSRGSRDTAGVGSDPNPAVGAA